MHHLFNILLGSAFLATLASGSAQADDFASRLPLKNSPGTQTLRALGRSNELEAKKLSSQLGSSPFKFDLTVKRPFADYEKVKYVLFSDSNQYESMEVKKVVLKNLPSDVTVVLLVDHGNEASTFNTYKKYIDASRLKVISTSSDSGSAFWARDALPVPVVMTDKLSGTESLGLIDAQYYYDFTSDSELASHFGAKVLHHSFHFEGGNFKADAKGNCFVEHNPSHDQIPDSIFTGTYGCKTLTRMPKADGIGHIDEHVNFVSDSLVLTDSTVFRDIFVSKGYQVRMLPTPQQNYETYANSLIVNGKAFVPIYGESGDAAALQVYKDAGLDAFGIRSNGLSTVSEGSIHCISMAYPDAPFTD